MKKIVLAALLSVCANAVAQNRVQFAGSDTLAGSLTDAIIAAGLDQQIQYTGGGSGHGEKGLLAGDQAIAPMSREMKPEVAQQLEAKGIQVTGHVLALDGLSILVKNENPIASLDVKTIARIFTCEFTAWEQIPNSGLKGQIHVYRRDDMSGTTDAFKSMTGVKAFGPCIEGIGETADLAEITSRDVNAIAYAGLSAKTADNRAVAIAKVAGSAAVLPTTATIRDFSYPLARKLYIYVASGALKPNAAEQSLLDSVLDRSFMDPIMQAHEFVTID